MENILLLLHVRTMKKIYMLNRIYNSFNKLEKTLFIESLLRAIFRWQGNPFHFLFSSHSHKNKSGLSLMELLVAMPMLAFVFLGMGYMLGISGNFTAIDIAKVKTQVTANNVLMLIKAENYSNLGNILGGVQTVETDGSLKELDNITIKKDSLVHPDGVSNLTLSVKKAKDSNNNDILTENGNNIYEIIVTAPDFENMQTIIKTVVY